MTQTLARPVALDTDTTRQWLGTIHARSAGHVWIGSAHDRFRGRTFDTRNPRWTDQAVDHIARLDQTGTPGIYLRTTTLRAVPQTGRGGDHDSLTLPGFAADLDIAGPGHKSKKTLIPHVDAARHVIDEAGLLTPTLWIHSGGGVYAWWLLDQPHTLTGDHPQAQAFSDRWQHVITATAERLGWSYGNVGDLSRILRIPGTVNRKAGLARPCRILEQDGPRYSLTNLRDNLADAEAALPPPPPVPIRPALPRPAGGGPTPGEDFEQQVDWADILTPHGWTFAYQRGTTRYWIRPGKERRDGISATTGRAGDRDRLYVFTDATDLPAREPITKFHALAVLEHGGRHADAGRALRRQGYGSRREAA